MSDNLFCFQCEQTAGCGGCTGKMGVCGKNADVAQLQDELIGALIGLARASAGHLPTASTHKAMIEGLFTTLTNVNFNEETIRSQIETVRKEKEAFIPGCSSCAFPCGRNDEYDMTGLWTEHEDIRSLKSLILFGLKGIAAYAYHAMVLGYSDDEVNHFFYEGLFAVGEKLDMEQLLPVVMKVGEINLKCMALLDKANTETYGHPAPVLFTTNCLMPPKDSYADRVFTTEVVSYPGMVHIRDEKDFTPVITKALELGGFNTDQELTGINGGKTVHTGFGHHTVLSVAEQIIDAVKGGKLKHIFLVGGCCTGGSI